MAQIALGTTTIENIVAHDAQALEKDLAATRADATVTLPGVPQIVTRLQQLLSDADVGIPQIVPVINYEPILVGRVREMWLRRAPSHAPHGDGSQDRGNPRRFYVAAQRLAGCSCGRCARRIR
jgi:hypothetical protein